MPISHYFVQGKNGRNPSGFGVQTLELRFFREKQVEGRKGEG